MTRPTFSLPVSCLGDLRDAVRTAIEEYEYRLTEWDEKDQEAIDERQRMLASFLVVEALLPTRPERKDTRP
jgi:hypothetical protein